MLSILYNLFKITNLSYKCINLCKCIDGFLFPYIMSIYVALNSIKQKNWSEEEKNYLINELCRRVHMVDMGESVAMYTHVTDIAKCLPSDGKFSSTDVVLKLHLLNDKFKAIVQFKNHPGIIFHPNNNVVTATSKCWVTMTKVCFNANI